MEENINRDIEKGSLFEREFFGIYRHNLISGTAERLLRSAFSFSSKKPFWLTAIASLYRPSCS